MTLNDHEDSPDRATSDDAAVDGSESASETRIDLAWRAMRVSDAAARRAAAGDDAPPADEAVDAAAAAFVDAILAEFLVCPVWDEDGEAPAAPERAQPKLVPVDGGEALALFDSEDRLAAYLDAPSAFIALPGSDFIRLAAAHGLAVAFNPEVAASAMTFAPATVAAIAELVAAGEEETEVGAGAAMEARAPSSAPPALLAALGARLAAARGVALEGWFFEAAFSEEPPRLVLGVVADEGASDAALSRLAAEISRLGSAVLGNADGLSVTVFHADDAILERVRAVGFGVGAPSGRAAAAG